MPKKTNNALTKAQHIDRITGIIVRYAGDLRDAIKLPDAKTITNRTKIALAEYLAKTLPKGLDSKVEAGSYIDDPQPAHAFVFRTHILGKWVHCGDADDYAVTKKVVEDARKEYVKANDKRQKLCVYTELKTARALAQRFYVRFMVENNYSISDIRKAFEAELKKPCAC